MKAMNCPQEEIVTRAVVKGDVEESLITHAAACAVCQEIIQTASWMQTLAQSAERNPGMPDASLLWWRARFSEEQAKVEKSYDFLEWAEITSVAVFLVGLASWIVWNWLAVQRLMAWVEDGAQLWMTAYTTPAVLLPLAAVFCLAALVLVYPSLGRRVIPRVW